MATFSLCVYMPKYRSTHIGATQRETKKRGWGEEEENRETKPYSEIPMTYFLQVGPTSGSFYNLQIMPLKLLTELWIKPLIKATLIIKSPLNDLILQLKAKPLPWRLWVTLHECCNRIDADESKAGVSACLHLALEDTRQCFRNQFL